MYGNGVIIGINHMRAIHTYFLLNLRVKHKGEVLFYATPTIATASDFLQGPQPLLKVHYFMLDSDVQKI